MTEIRPSVLFVCVHNAGRSQMAAGYLTALAAGRVDVFSAGSQPAAQVNPVAVAVMAEEGIDIASEVPSILTPTPSAPPTWSSPWAAATPARSSRGSATRTGSSTTRPDSRSRRSAASGTTSRHGCGRCCGS